MIEYLWIALWLLLDNAEVIFDICLLGVTFFSWITMGAFGLFVVWIAAPHK